MGLHVESNGDEDVSLGQASQRAHYTMHKIPTKIHLTASTRVPVCSMQGMCWSASGGLGVGTQRSLLCVAIKVEFDLIIHFR